VSTSEYVGSRVDVFRIALDAPFALRLAGCRSGFSRDHSTDAMRLQV